MFEIDFGKTFLSCGLVLLRPSLRKEGFWLEIDILDFWPLIVSHFCCFSEL